MSCSSFKGGHGSEMSMMPRLSSCVKNTMVYLQNAGAESRTIDTPARAAYDTTVT